MTIVIILTGLAIWFLIAVFVVVVASMRSSQLSQSDERRKAERANENDRANHSR